MELLGVRHSQKRLPVITVLGERTSDPLAFAQNRLSCNAAHSDAGGYKEAVLHGVCSGADGERVTGAQLVRGFLQRGTVGSDNICRTGLGDGHRPWVLTNRSP